MIIGATVDRRVFMRSAVAAGDAREIRHRNYQGNFPRLLAIKNKSDPGNLFRLNANINPAAGWPGL